MATIYPIIVIPSRLESTRLPNKPILPIGEKSMIEHCFDRAREADIGDVVVATANQEIVDIIQSVGGRAYLSDPNLPSGSDRIAAVLSDIDSERKYSHVINFQGDLPLFNPKDLSLLMNKYEKDNMMVRTLVAAISDRSEIHDHHVVKVQVGFSEHERIGEVARAISFSRQAVPWGQGTYWHHIGIYGYPRAVLENFVRLPVGVLEKRERLEQLRLLENGYGIEAVIASSVPISVDTNEDLEKVRSLWLGKK